MEHKTESNMNVHLLVSISKGVRVLHTLGVAHRDIKPENILVFSMNQQNTTVKLCDFGISRTINDKSITNALGSPYYIAPEVQQARDQQQLISASSGLLKADIWSLGKLIYFIWVRIDLQTLKEQQHWYHEVISNASINELIKACLYDDPKKRPDIDGFFQQLVNVNL